MGENPYYAQCGGTRREHIPSGPVPYRSLPRRAHNRITYIGGAAHPRPCGLVATGRERNTFWRELWCSGRGAQMARFTDPEGEGPKQHHRLSDDRQHTIPLASPAAQPSGNAEPPCTYLHHTTRHDRWSGRISHRTGASCLPHTLHRIRAAISRLRSDEAVGLPYSRPSSCSSTWGWSFSSWMARTQAFHRRIASSLSAGRMAAARSYHSIASRKPL